MVLSAFPTKDVVRFTLMSNDEIMNEIAMRLLKLENDGSFPGSLIEDEIYALKIIIESKALELAKKSQAL